MKCASAYNVRVILQLYIVSKSLNLFREKKQGVTSWYQSLGLSESSTLISVWSQTGRPLTKKSKHVRG